MCLVALATGLLLPIEILQNFADHKQLDQHWTLFSLIGIIDIGISFNTAVEHNGIAIRNPRSIARHYLRGMFWLDALANIPFLMANTSGIQSEAVILLPLLRLARLLYITGRWEDLQIMSAAAIRMIRYVMILSLIANGVTCLWLWVGLTEAGPLGWIQRLELSRDNFGNLYLHSLYWTITTLATVGYGDITAKTPQEMILAVSVMITGAVLMAIAIGNVVGIFNQLDEGRREHRNRQSAITHYLRTNGVQPGIVERIRHFNEYNWARSRGVNLEEMIAGLPRGLRSEVTLEILGDTVHKVPLLEASSAHLRKCLLSALRPCSYPPNTVVLDEGEIGSHIIFVTAGRLEIQSSAFLTPETRFCGIGDYIGDLSFFLKERRNTQVASTSYVDGFSLSRASFDALYNQEPELKQLLKEVSAQQSQRNHELLIANVIV